MIYIVDEIGKVVQSMRNGGTFAPYDDNDANLSPYYMYGHRSEISERLTTKELDKVKKKKKYPLIALNTRSIKPNVRGQMWDFNLNIVLCTKVDDNLSTEEREAKIFKPILYPLYEQFKKSFSNSGLFLWSGELKQDFPPHTPMIEYFWGSENENGSIKNILNDPTCAIEIVDLKFSVDKNSRC